MCNQFTNASDIQLLNNTCIQAIEQGQLPIYPDLPPKARTVQLISAVTNSSLLSIGQLCNNDCITLFHKKKI